MIWKMARNKHPKISTIPSKGMKYRSPLSLIRKNRKNDKCVSNNSNPSSEQKENLAAQ